MEEYKGLSFVVIDEKGKPHRIKLDKVENMAPDVTIYGDRELLLKRLKTMVFLAERSLSLK